MDVRVNVCVSERERAVCVRECVCERRDEKSTERERELEGGGGGGGLGKSWPFYRYHSDKRRRKPTCV